MHFTTFEHNNVGKNFRNRILKILPYWVVFPKKTQKLLTKFLGFTTSGRHNSAMITDHRKFTTKLPLCGMSSFHFYRFVRRKMGEIVRYLPRKKLAASQTVAAARIAPKICQDQPSTMCSQPHSAPDFIQVASLSAECVNNQRR